MKVVSNSSPLIGLGMIGRFDLMRKLYKKISTPQAVYQEVVVEGRGRPGSSETQKGIGEKWMRLRILWPSILSLNI